MSCFKDLPSLIEKIDEVQDLIETTDPESLMKIKLELEVLSETIQGIIKDYEKQHPAEGGKNNETN